MSNSFAHLRLWQLISPTLPVGAYAFSAGLEYACEAGWIRTEAATGDWVGGQLEHALAALDVPVLARLYRAWERDDDAAIDYWNGFLGASRETRELQEEDRHMGAALARLLTDLDIDRAEAWLARGDGSFLTLFTLAAQRWQVSLETTAAGYLWAWCENQVAAAIKLVPLGQTAGQRLLLKLSDRIPACMAHGLALADDDIGVASPGVVLASSRHETQYSRLFRS